MYHITSNKKLHLFKTVSVAEVEALNLQHKDNPHDLFWAFRSLIFNEIPLPKKIDNEIFWKKMTKPQQIVWTLGIFIEQVNNGGLWQFLFNKTEYITAVGVSFETFSNMNRFNTFYTRCFNEFAEMLHDDSFFEICRIWNNEALPFEERWAAFKGGEVRIPHRTEFETYFYSEEGKKNLYGMINKYVEQQLGSMIKVEGQTEVKEIDKKAAIPHFTEYLTAYYNAAPTEVSIYYSANVTIDNMAAKLFLMRFMMSDGYESMGITGHFTHHFPEVNWDDIKNMYQKSHKQKLINIFNGWRLLDKEEKKNPNAHDFDEAKWTNFLSKLQKPTNTQIPVNIKFMDALQYDGDQMYKFSGDLLYNEIGRTIFPSDLDNVPVLSVHDKKETGYRGELNKLFTSTDAPKPFFGRQGMERDIENICFWERFLGSKYKIIKDNPWGF